MAHTWRLAMISHIVIKILTLQHSAPRSYSGRQCRLSEPSVRQYCCHKDHSDEKSNIGRKSERTTFATANFFCFLIEWLSTFLRTVAWWYCHAMPSCGGMVLELISCFLCASVLVNSWSMNVLQQDGTFNFHFIFWNCVPDLDRPFLTY